MLEQMDEIAKWVAVPLVLRKRVPENGHHVKSIALFRRIVPKITHCSHWF